MKEAMQQELRRRPWAQALVLLACLVGLGCDDSSSDSTPSAQAQAPIQSAPQSEPATPIQSAPTQSAPAAPVQSVPIQSEATPIQSAPTQSAPERSADPAPLERGDVTGGMAAAISGREVESPLVMKTSLEPRDGKWIARWEIRNRSDEPVYLVTQLPVRKSGRIVPDAARIYRRAEEGTLHLTKRLWRIPAGVAPLLQELPYLLRLEPGQSSAGAIRVPPSLLESYPYQAGRGAAPGLARAVVISFGYFTGDAQPVPSKANPALFEVAYRALDTQRFLTGEPHAARLMVR